MTFGARKGTDRDDPQGGNHMARLVGIVDLGHQPGYKWKGNDIDSEWKFGLIYELVNSLMKDGRPHYADEQVKNNFWEGNNKKSNLAARVRSLDVHNETQDGSDLSKMLGKPCMVEVQITDKGYPKVSGAGAVSGIPIGMEVAELTNEPFMFAFSNNDQTDQRLEPDMEVWNRLSPVLKDRIRKSLNFDDTKLAQVLAEEDQY